MKSHDGVWPYRDEMGKWEISSGVYTDIHGAKHPTKKKIVKAGTSKQAAEIRKRWINDLIVGGTPQSVKGTSQEGPACITLGRYAQEYYLPWLKAEMEDTTHRGREQHLRSHIIPVIGRLDLSEAGSHAAVSKLKEYLKVAKGFRKNSARNRVLTTLSAIITHASSPETAPKHRPLITKTRISRFSEKDLAAGEERIHRGGFVLGYERHKRLSEEQYAAILKEARNNDRDYVLICLGAMAGCRRGEIAARKWADIDWTKRRIHIHSHIGAVAQNFKPYVKNGLPGWVPMERSLSSALERLKEKSTGPYILQGSHGDGHLSTDDVAAVYAKLCLSAFGKRSYAVHRLRHTYGSRWADAGTRVEVIQMLMRHKSIKSTFGYITVMDEAMDNLDSVLAPPGPSLEVLRGGRSTGTHL